ncbi:hypothetical protein C2845_PM09G11720 [Panicum miliaceum]|uniref:Retrotransposon protein, putative, unclassified n=1 Tax=Panicum miliaceum TaxID=4540 RepID=A0A3L6RXG1_PANMI|nr:hypothetical protein C2845_PM09G11720 [Panicum miliaceum]
MLRKYVTGRGKKRGNEGGDEWRSSSIRERDLLPLVAERVLQEEGVMQWWTAGSDSSPWDMTAADKALYLEYTTPSSLSGWQAQWFYIGNHQPSLPRWDNSPPRCQECWLKKLTEEERRDILELMKQIKALMDKGITRESLADSFNERCIQPLHQRVHLGFEYQGLQDPSRMAMDVPSVEEIMHRVTRLFTGETSEPYIPRLFGTGNSPDPADLEQLRFDPPEPTFEEPSQGPPAKKAVEDAAADPPHLQQAAMRKRRAAAAIDTTTSCQIVGTEEDPEPPRQGVVRETRERSLAVGRSPPLTFKPASPHSGNKTAPRGLVVPKVLPLRKPARAYGHESRRASDRRGCAGGGQRRKSRAPANPEVEPKTQALGTTPGPGPEEDALIVQQTVASTLGQQEAPENSWAQQQQEVPENSWVLENQEGEVPWPNAGLFEDPLLELERSLIGRSWEKLALLHQIGDVLPCTHKAEDDLYAEKAKSAKLQEDLAALKTSH